MRCEVCDNSGWGCENHPDRPSDCGDSKRACTCGGAGMPCLVCNQPEPGERPRLPAALCHAMMRTTAPSTDPAWSTATARHSPGMSAAPRWSSAGSSTAAVRSNTAPRSTAPSAGPRSGAAPPRTRPPRRLPAGGPRGDPLHPGPGGGAGDGCRRRRGLRDVCLAAWLRSVHVEAGSGAIRCVEVKPKAGATQCC